MLIPLYNSYLYKRVIQWYRLVVLPVITPAQQWYPVKMRGLLILYLGPYPLYMQEELAIHSEN